MNQSKPVTTGRDPDEGTVPWYRRMFELCKIDRGYEGAVAADVNTVLRGEARYRLVEEKTGVPWWVIGAIHFKEASCNFAGVLHNGEKIIGTGRKTKLVPAGRGPFATWEEAAIDAITLNGARWAKLRAGSRDIGEILYAAERYNGSAYLSKTSDAGKENSPYLWARSNINDGFGKYVRDHVFDPNATTQKTTGLAVILKELAKAGKIKLT